MDKSITKAWQQFENGKDYKRKIGLYDTVRRNERYYRGEQWYGVPSDLPKPIFNVVRRIIDYLICTVVSGNISIRYTDESLPYTESPAQAEAIRRGVEVLTGNASYRWENEHMDTLVYRLMLDAAISGDGVLYCSWDPAKRSFPLCPGDMRTQLIDNINLFVADVNRADIQSQDYIIISGRQSVSSLRREAALNGADGGETSDEARAEFWAKI